MAKNMQEPGSGFGGKMAMARGRAAAVDAVDHLLDVQPGATVVELGPGCGDSLRPILAKAPALVYSIEIAEAFRQVIKTDAQFAKAISDGTLRLSGDDALRLPAETGTVDRILAINVIYFLDPQLDYHKEMYRVLKPGGKILWVVKEVAKSFDPKVYVNTKWDKILEEMRAAGFSARQDEARLEGRKGHFEYIPLWGMKPMWHSDEPGHAADELQKALAPGYVQRADGRAVDGAPPDQNPAWAHQPQSGTAVIPPRPAPKDGEEDPWLRAVASDGNEYWYHRVTNEVVWEHPGSGTGLTTAMQIRQMGDESGNAQASGQFSCESANQSSCRACCM